MENINKIKKNLNTKILGKEIVYLEEIDSTQDYIKTLAKKSVCDGLVVIAENQTKGKGTNGRVWYTQKEQNLTFSFLLKPNCNIKKLDNFTIIIAEVIVKVIKDLYDCDLDIKYPNDIMVGNKKVRRNTYRKLYNGRNCRIYYCSE